MLETDLGMYILSLTVNNVLGDSA